MMELLVCNMLLILLILLSRVLSWVVVLVCSSVM